MPSKSWCCARRRQAGCRKSFGPCRVEGIFPLFETTAEADFEKEVQWTRAAASYGVAPRFYRAWICPEFRDILVQERTGYVLGFLVMQKLDTSLTAWAMRHRDLYVTWRDHLQQLLTEKLRVLLEHGIVYKDIHGDNVLLQVDDQHRPLDLFIIDYSPAEVVHAIETEKPTIWRELLGKIDTLFNELDHPEWIQAKQTLEEEE